MTSTLVSPIRWRVCPAAEVLLPSLERPLRKGLEILLMAGSKSNYLSKKFADEILGATAFSAPATVYAGLWTGALDDTFTGGTASEAAYGSYARMSLTNNTTNFAAGSGTTTYTKTFPSDAAHTWATSSSGTSVVTYMGLLDGNAGSAADNGLFWTDVTSVTINSGDTPRLAQNAASLVEN